MRPSTAIVGELRNTDAIMNDTFFIGVYPGMTGEHLAYIGETFRRFMEGQLTAMADAREIFGRGDQYPAAW